MRQSGHWDGGTMTRQVLVDLLHERFAAIDFKQAAEEVRVFLPDPRELQLWSREFFDGLAGRMSAGRCVMDGKVRACSRTRKSPPGCWPGGSWAGKVLAGLRARKSPPGGG